MNQIAASILILASAVFSSTAMSTNQEATTLFGAAALASGLSGLVALAAAILPRHRDFSWGARSAWGALDRLNDPIGMTVPPRSIHRGAMSDEGLTVRLPADLKSQLNYLANLRGQDRDQVVQELLRRNLSQSARTSRVA